MVFFIVWTALAIAGAWLLLHPGAPSPPHSPVLFNGRQDSQASAAEQLRTWLKLADINFRGAYPWLLLAPYIAWLALRFPLERGRLRRRIPLHLAAYALFAAACHLLTAREEARGERVIMVVNRNAHFPADLLAGSNFSQFLPAEGFATNLSNMEVSMRQSGDFAGAGVRVNPDELPGLQEVSNLSISNGLHVITVGVTTNDAPVISTTTTSSNGLARVTTAAWSSSVWTAPKPFGLLLDFLAYGALVGSAHAVHFYRRFREREQRAVLLESNLAQARLHALQAQLHPHFLFNALNAVATLIRSNPAAALETLTSFSDLLRLALSQSGKAEMPLRDDLRFLECYLEIQQVRLGDRLRVESQVEPAALDCLVPALLMQPLVENALRHGIEPSANPGFVRFTANLVGEKLVLTIADNGIGLEAARNAQSQPGIGLANLRTRLTTLYGNNQLLEIGPNPGGGVLVRVELPRRIDAIGASGVEKAAS